MNLTHVRAITDTIIKKYLESILMHISEAVVLRTPLVAEPIHGKAAIRPVVSALLGVVDRFDFREIMQGPKHVSSFFKVTVGPNELDGMDYWRLNDGGLIEEMTVLWRPLPAAVAVQQLLVHGGPKGQ